MSGPSGRHANRQAQLNITLGSPPLDACSVAVIGEQRSTASKRKQAQASERVSKLDSSNYLTSITADSTSPRSDHRDLATPPVADASPAAGPRRIIRRHAHHHTQRYPPRHAGPDSQSPIAGSRQPQCHGRLMVSNRNPGPAPQRSGRPGISNRPTIEAAPTPQGVTGRPDSTSHLAAQRSLRA